MRNLFVYRIAVIAAVAGLIVFLLFRFFAPFGAVVSYQFNSILNSDKVSQIQGAQDASSFSPTQAGVLQIPKQIIRQSVVTFNLKLITKPIEGVWVNLRFQGNPKEIKIGVRGSEKDKYHYLPLYNQILNSLSWSQITDGNTTLWQRQKKYKDISELATKLPQSEPPQVASYFFNQSDIVMKESGSSSQNNLKIEKTLRGSHTLLVKVDKKPLLLTVVKQDANAYKGADVLSMQVYNGQNKIADQSIPDDGVTDGGGLMMTPQTSEIKINDIKPGIYKVILKDMTEHADIEIKSIEANQPLLVFQPPLFIIDEKPVVLWTNSKKITMRTPHPVGVQTVKLDGRYNLEVEKEGKEFEFDLTNPESKTATPAAGTTPVLHKLDIPKNDLAISGDGYFAFSEASFFNPEPIKTVDLSQVSDINKIDYIIANYQPVKKDGDWNVAQAYFDPKDITIDGDKLSFSLESPELDSNGGEIVIDSLEVTVTKPGWFQISAGQKEKETGSVGQKEAGKRNVFVRAYDWTAGSIGAVKNTVVTALENAWRSVRGFYEGIFGGIFSEKPVTPTATPTTEPSPTPTTTPAPVSSAVRYDTLVRVLNGGAEAGVAASVATLLKANGFTNVKADNADRSDYKGTTIRYRSEDTKTADKLETLLKKDYGTVTKVTVSTTTAEVVIIVGKK